MDPKNLHSAAGELFRKALELSPEEREEFLRSECADQPEVRSEVDSLLEYHADDSFLEQPKIVGPGGLPPPTSLPTKVGSYRIERLLGWGGAGVVYLAAQSRPRRRVALKVMHANLSHGDALARFRRESEILARLDHPGITRVVESGELETPDGVQAFIAMEYVEGAPLMEHARVLGHRERLELGAELARIVEHAHLRGFVHRDLKPANIVVKPDGQPVVLDFGIARRIGDAEGATDNWTEFVGETVTGQLLGTLAYMSPEQAAGDAGAIDERTDVYALGVILFELITGKLPYDTRDKLITEAIRLIERGDPTPLSHYGRSYRGDLETIVEKAMRKEPARRYYTAGGLAKDLELFLASRPIEGRPPSPLYRSKKFLSRHRRASYSTIGVLALLLTALLSSLSSLRAANNSESEARRERAIALRFADEMLLEKLISETDQLWPARPEELSRFEDWLARAEQLRTSREVHVLHAAGSESSPDDPTGLERLRVLVARLDDFAAAGGEFDIVRKRYEFARNLEARTVIELEAEWAEACAAIADQSRAPLYEGLSIQPQVGLIPLGPDPDSGLWEFSAFGPTGTPPKRDVETGKLEVDESSGLVFVLIPGGEFWFGAQASDPTGINYDPFARAHEGPPEQIALEPFFLAKYEWTQAQWTRITGSNPSYYADGDHVDETIFTSQSPVESVTWTECVELLAKLRLTLPTEAQWEYAARAGSGTAFWSGDDVESILLGSNLAEKPPDDARERMRMHGPVGALAANAFGLHDTSGNVSEWCLDVFKVDCRAWPVRPSDGLRLTPDGPERVLRGGSWASAAHVARSARRDDQLFYMGSAIIGFRAARALDR